MLVLFSDVVLLTQVDEVDNRLSGKEEQRINNLDLIFVMSVTCGQNDCEVIEVWK
jgi:hypothetical protein